MTEFSQVPQYTSQNEPAAISILDSEVDYHPDQKDLARLRRTANHWQNIAMAGGEKMSLDEVVQWSQNLWGEPGETPKKVEQITWAIRGRLHHTTLQNSGELMGYVTAYTPTKAILKRMRDVGLLEQASQLAHTSSTQVPVYEISYAIDLDGAVEQPADYKGLAVSAIRQVTLQIGAMQSETNFSQHPESETVYPQALIIAFIKPENTFSLKAATEAGFVELPDQVKYHGNDKNTMKVLVADWDKVSNSLKH